MEHTRQLDADHSPTHTNDALREFGQMPAGVAVDHIASINARKGGHERDGTGGQDDFVRMKLLLRSIPLTTIISGDRDRVRGIDGSQSIEHINMVTLHQCTNATSHPLNDIGGKLNSLPHVQRRGLWEVNAEFA